MFKSSIRGIVTPPPVLEAEKIPTSSSAITSDALTQSLYLSVPSSASAQTTISNCRMRHVNIHPSLPLIVYAIEFDTISDKYSPQRQLVVQNIATRQVAWKLSLGDLASMMFDFDLGASSGKTKQSAALRSLGSIMHLDFCDPATLHASGMVHEKVDSERHPRWQFLLVHFPSRVVVLNLRIGPHSHALDIPQRLRVPSVAQYPPFRPFVTQILEQSLKAVPTTTALPLTPTLYLVGCSDGGIKVYDWIEEREISGFPPPTSKNDAIHSLVAANLYNAQPPGDNIKTIKRVISVSKKGTAYLWEIVMAQDTLIDVRVPLARMDGQFGSVVQSDSAATLVDNFEHTLMEYDAHRDLFMWLVPSGYKNSSKPHVLMWNLKQVATLKRSKKMSIPKLDPIVVSFPSVETTPVSVLMGWNHPAFLDGALTCALMTSTGDLFVQSLSLTGAKPGKVAKKSHPFFAANLPALIQKDAQMPGPPMVRVLSIQTQRRLDTTSLLIASNVGLIHMSLEAGGVGPRHAHFGAGFGNEFGNSILSVDDSSILWSPIASSSPNPVGRVALKQGTVVYKSPPSLNAPPETQKRPVRLPPRILVSPSGCYLALYWPEEMRYEILHLLSIFRRSSTADGANASPAVAHGENITSFAWVGDEDVFALLHPPLETRPDSGAASDTASTAPSSGASVSGSASVKSAFRKANLFTRGKSNALVLSSPTTIQETTSNNNDGSRFLPTVELKVLVGVTSNAAEISGSVAAATASSLGDLTLRGGNRNPPTALFGGPALCVACEGKSASDGGSAYFYTRKPGADETRASVYASSGPTLPNPDFVEWDDDGRLCAVVVQGMVAVYLSQEPEFSLLGNVQLGNSADRDVTVTGVKFVHSALYCTTKNSVQVIFMGDRDEGICHLDSYMLASANGPSLPQRSFSLTPPTCPMTLNCPVVLGYHSGSLLVSTVNGVCTVPLDHPLLRIGSLLSAEQPSRALKWFEAIPESSHEALACFLDRRGFPDLVFQLSGVSVENLVDLALRNGLTDELIQIVDSCGVEGLRRIDQGRGVPVGILGPEEHTSQSLIVAVGAFLLSKGRANRVQKMTHECLRRGKDGDENMKQTAFVLASLLLAVDSQGVRPLVEASVAQRAEEQEDDGFMVISSKSRGTSEYPVNSAVRDYIV